MRYPEFKNRLSEIVTIHNEAEKRRFDSISRKELSRSMIRLDKIETDKEVKEAWIKFNKKQADWEKYCRREQHNRRQNSHKYNFGDFSCLAYNGVADDF